MRVLHCVHSYPPEAHGGTQEYLAALVAWQRSQGHAVAVIAGSSGHAAGGALWTEEVAGTPVWRVVRDLEQERHGGNLSYGRVGALCDAARCTFGPDLVHVHHWATLTNDLVRRAAADGLPVVVTLHDLFVSCPRLFRMPDPRHLCSAAVTVDDCAACIAAELASPRAERRRLLLQRRDEFEHELGAAAAILTVSAAQQRLLAQLPLGRLPPMQPLPIGVQPPAVLPPPPAPLTGRLRIANWAGIDPRKGIDVLLAAVAGSRDPCAFEVHLHGRDGEDSYMRELRRLAHGLDVTWHGPFATGEQWTFGGRYDVAVFPFLAFETHGLVVDEALHAGLPVLVSDHGAPPHRLGGRGRTFPAGDADALRRLLERLLDQPAERKGMRQAPHAAIALEAHAAALQAIYERMLAGRDADARGGR